MNIKDFILKTKAFYIFLALVLVQEMVISPILFPKLFAGFDNLELQIWLYKKKQIENSNINPDVLVLGDSKALGGVDPDLFEEITNKKMLNLAIPAIQPAAQYYLLEKYLANNPEPKEIYYLPSPEMLTDNVWTEYFFNKRTINWFLSRTEALITIIDRFPEEDIGKPLGQLLLRTFFPTSIFRSDLVKHFNNYSDGKLSKVSKKNLKTKKYLNEHNGFKPWLELSYLMGKPSQEYTKYVLENPNHKHTHWYKIYDLLYVFNPTPNRIKYFKKTLEVLNNLPNTKVYFLQIPEPDSLFKRREDVNYHKYVDNFLTEIKKEYFNIKFLKLTTPSIADNNFEDLMHLNDKGALLFTGQLAKRSLSFD